jgi:hypothetical protein
VVGNTAAFSGRMLEHNESTKHYVVHCEVVLHGGHDLTIIDTIDTIDHGRTRHSQIPLVMKAPRCKTNAFQASFYNRIVKLWNTICKTAPVHGFSNISSFKQLLKQTYLTLFNASFDIDFPCTWTLSRDCSCH